MTPSLSQAQAEPMRRTSLADRYRVLLEIGRTLTRTHGRAQLFRRIYHETSRVLDAAGFYISTYDSRDDLATVVFYADQGVERHVEITYRGSESEVIRTGRASSFTGPKGFRSLMILGDDDADTTRSAISAPMRFEGRVIGAISAQSYHADAYSAEDMELLQGIADVAAVAMENAHKMEELESRRLEAEKIEAIGRAVVSSLQPDRVIRQVVEAALELVNCDTATVWHLDEDRNAHVQASGGEEPIPEGTTLPIDQDTFERLVESRRPAVIPDVSAPGVLPPELKDKVSARSALLVPLIVSDEVVGALSVGSRSTRSFGESVDILERLASQASVALENARLHADVQALSLTDPLTGLPNRRQLEIHLDREVAAARRGRMVAAVLYDLDNFKQVNDTFGHYRGDEILKAFGQILQHETRTMNLVARYGGDEFISVVSETSLEGVTIGASRVQARVKEHELLGPHGVTVSFGVAQFGEGMEDRSDLIRAADADLYRKKVDLHGTDRYQQPPPAVED